MHWVFLFELIESGLCGVALGILYFISLWWTVQRLTTARQPALLMMTSYMIRIGILLGGIIFVSNGELSRIAACLAGFILARWIACRIRGPVPANNGEKV
jgi:F1F0 ATPase subunit 2